MALGTGETGTTRLVGDGAVTPVCPRRRRFLCRVSSGVNVLGVGGVVAEARTGQDIAKKRGHSLGEGKATRRAVWHWGQGRRRKTRLVRIRKEM